ncbi:MAG: RsmE family RNA methyltransferase [Patescibacteria group bacterium]|nr:RsmE family RNA methyltransferase [Patescibacteria group bacterium]
MNAERRKTHRFFTAIERVGNGIRLTDSAVCHQIARVLRLRPGETIVLANDGQETEARLIEVAPGKVMAEMLSVKDGRRAKRRVTLYCAIIKKDNFELTVQKATEVGVAAIVPIITEHTVKLGLRQERLEKIAREAAEQSERADVPVITPALSLEQALRQAIGERVFLDAEGEPWHGQAAVSEVSLFIGPEGGWTEAEIAKAKEADCRLARLGGLVLRAETAAVVASHLACWPLE